MSRTERVHRRRAYRIAESFHDEWACSINLNDVRTPELFESEPAIGKGTSPTVVLWGC